MAQVWADTSEALGEWRTVYTVWPGILLRRPWCSFIGIEVRVENAIVRFGLFSLFEKVSHYIDLVGLELTIWLRLTYDLGLSPCLHLLSAGIIGEHCSQTLLFCSPLWLLIYNSNACFWEGDCSIRGHREMRWEDRRAWPFHMPFPYKTSGQPPPASKDNALGSLAFQNQVGFFISLIQTLCM